MRSRSYGQIFSWIMGRLDDSVKENVIDFTNCRLKTGQTAIRVTVGRLLDDKEKESLKSFKNIVGVDCVCHHKYAPEIQYSYFYVV